eukprot:6140789-Pyramimonas_sp.AAC.1
MGARPDTCPGSIGSSERPRIEWFSLVRFKFVSYFSAQPWSSPGYQPRQYVASLCPRTACVGYDAHALATGWRWRNLANAHQWSSLLDGAPTRISH